MVEILTLGTNAKFMSAYVSP